MQVQLEKITPAKAAHYLERNTANRPIRRSLVLTYARQMLRGNWKLTHQGIALNCDGTVLDGQHRLAAIVEAGVTVDMLVTSGLETETQMLMDDHAKRNAADAISLNRKERITTKQIAILRGCVELGAADRRAESRLSKTELNAIFERLSPAIEFAIGHSAISRGVTCASVASAIALAWFYVDNLDRLREFIDTLHGKRLPEGDSDKAAITLREMLLSRGVRYANQRQDAFLKTERAIVSFMKYEPLTKLYGTSVYYPWPLVDAVR